MSPVCGSCGGYYVPALDNRGARCLGFAGVLTGEQGAVGIVARLRRLMGFTWKYVDLQNDDPEQPQQVHHGMIDYLLPPAARYYTAEECQRTSDRIAESVAMLDPRDPEDADPEGDRVARD